MRKVFFWALMPLLFSCIANKTSCFVKNEKVELELEMDSITSTNDENKALSFPLDLITGQVVNLGIKGIGKELKKEVKRYGATYRASKSGDDFYKKDTSGVYKLRYKWLKLERKILSKNKGDDTIVRGIKNPAVKLKFGFEVDDSGYFFKIIPNSVAVNYTKAKRNFNDETIDLIVDISLYGFWVDKEQKYHNEKVSEVSFPIKNIKIGKPKTKKELEKISSDWLALIPLSEDKKGNYKGLGNYKLEVVVNEIDDFGKKVEKVSDLFSDNEDSIIEFLKSKLD